MTVHSEMYWKVLNCINNVDPMSLLKHGAPYDEYESEVSDIVKLLPQVKSINELQERIYKVFAHWFDAALVGPISSYSELAVEIWAIKEQHL